MTHEVSPPKGERVEGMGGEQPPHAQKPPEMEIPSFIYLEPYTTKYAGVDIIQVLRNAWGRLRSLRG
ncbi:MAG: hypothetical protein RI911_679 [Candidatus Parcubacteria bacterium]|jgi:hypothetical protein